MIYSTKHTCVFYIPPKFVKKLFSPHFPFPYRIIKLIHGGDCDVCGDQWGVIVSAAQGHAVDVGQAGAGEWVVLSGADDVRGACAYGV